MSGWDQSILAFVRAAKGKVDVGQIAKACGIKHSSALQKVIRLADEGLLVDHGGWLSAAALAKDAPAGQARLWAVCHHLNRRGPWSKKDLVLLAEASESLVKNYLRFLAVAGHVKTEAATGRGNVKQYRLAKDAPPAGRPPVMTKASGGK